MKNNLYLTQVHFKSSTRSKSLHSKPIKSQNKNSAYITKNTGFYSAKKSMLEYIISEQTQYADLNKCEDFYKKLFYKNYQEYNAGKSELSKKQKRVSELEATIEQELVYSANIEKTDIIEYYENILRDTEKKLIYDGNDYLCYQHLLKRTTRQNMHVRLKIFEFLDFEDKNKKLYDKYKVISVTAKRALKMQKGLLNDMKEFGGRCNDMYEEEIEGKKYKFNELEYNVFKIKSSTAEIEKSIAVTKELIVERIENIKNLKKKNIRLKDNIIAMKKKLMKTKTKLLKIYKKLKVKSLEDIIKRFKNERIQYQGYNSQYLNLNKEISEKNTIFTQLCHLVEDLKNQIEKLKNEEKIYLFKMSQDQNLQTIDLKGKVLIEENSSLFKIAMEKHKILKNFCSFMVDYDKHLIKLINKMMDIKKIKVKRYTKNEIMKCEDNHTSIYNTDQNMMTINQITDWSSNERNLILGYFNNFQYNIMYLFTSYVMSISQSYFLKRPSNNNDKKEKPVIIPVFHSDLNSILDDYITKALYHLENKYKILSRSEREIFKEHKPIIEDNKKSKDLNINRKVHLSSIFSNYYKKKSEQESTDTQMLNSIKPKLYIHLGKFTNELVTDEVEKKELKSSQIISNKTSPKKKEPEVFLTMKEKIKKEKVKKKRELQKKKLNENDSYEEPSIEEKEDKPIEKKNLYGYQNNMHEEMNLLYKRMGDIHNLEKIYFRDKEASKVKNGNFEELYYNFKKKIDKSKNKILTNLRKNRNSVEKGSQGSKIEIFNMQTTNDNNNIQETKSLAKQSSSKQSLNMSNSNINNITNSYAQKRTLSKDQYFIKEKYLSDLFNDDYLQSNQEELKRLNIEKKKLNNIKSTSGFSSTMFSVGNEFTNSNSYLCNKCFKHSAPKHKR